MKKLGVILLLGIFNYSPANALPYHPSDSHQVLETLPIRGQNWLEIRKLRQSIAENPQSSEPALVLARRYIELGRAESDPRYYGYAEAVLAPWLKQQNPEPEVLTLQATLYQNRHDFPHAMALLNSALRYQPRLPQAWLTRAVILEVQGDYPAAMKSCQPLGRLATVLTAAVCTQSVRSLSGALDDAYQQLQQIITIVPAEPTEKQWALTTLAEMAERKGDSLSAEKHYQAALAQAGRNGYLLATYSDFLLDQQRFTDVEALLQNEIRQDGLLLRLTLAEHALRLPVAEQHTALLTTRFAASRLRGDTAHQGDEARFYLKLLHQPQQALTLAQQNWEVQREPRDTRILLESAFASGQPEATETAVQFLKTSHLQDARLTALLTQLREPSHENL